MALMQILSAVCLSLITPPLHSENNCLIIGHRGACGYAPENTLLSFETAIKLGVDVVELDVQCCKSGELIVMHDSLIDRTTNGKGLVAELTLDELSKYRGPSDQIIPTLQQVIDLVNRRCIINIELKGPDTAKPVAELIEFYVKKKGFSHKDFFVSSFNHHELLTFHKLLPQIETGAIMEAIPVNYTAFVDDAEADCAVLCQNAINQALIDDAHQRNKKVFVYTVNTDADIKLMKKLKVDGIISNYPDRVRP
ncbi:MAG: hypothetical protein K2Y01_00805 [Rhabdochlamydiaceae bacterium]|nr:hypothetical protein [Rhabdochlamydiaceae bacterium]